MIRVVRPATPPAALLRAEARHLAAFEIALGARPPAVRRVHEASGLAAHQPVTAPLPRKIEGYTSARRSLYLAQHRKCCYCERAVEEAHQDVEHFRPKAVYWWLAWSWGNLLFACKTCNEHKGDSFPLGSAFVGGPRTTAGNTERPLLIDPADPSDPDPVAHIEFRPVSGRWMPFPRAGSRRGAWLIQTCRLDRPSLLDAYRHSAAQLEDALERVEAALGSQDRPRIEGVWEDVTQRWLAAGAPFVGLVHDVLAQRFPNRRRARYALALAVRRP